MTADTQRRRAMGQIVLLAAAFLVLVAISAASVVLVTQSRKDNAWVVHTVEVENQLSTLLLQIRRAESAARGYLLTSEPRLSEVVDVPCESMMRPVEAIHGCERSGAGTARR